MGSCQRITVRFRCSILYVVAGFLGPVATNRVTIPDGFDSDF